MPEHEARPDDGQQHAPRSVWRRSTVPSALTGGEPEPPPLRCGGPELSVDERYLMMRELWLAQKAEQDAAEQEAEARAVPKPDGQDQDEDDDRAAERFRNDRYAVKLLRQEHSAWDGPGRRDPGALG